MSLPLQGLRVLDLSRVLAGPWCTQLLGDLGADVIKVERLGHGDDTRHWGPPFISENQSAYFQCANRNKRSVFIDLSAPEHLYHLLSLSSQADVIVENFKFKGLEKYGLDYDSLKDEHPHLIYCSIRGFGRGSHLQSAPGYDALIQAMSGLMHITGPEGGEPVKVGVAVSDILTGLYAANAIQSALIERQRSGLGQLIEVSLLDTQVATLANVLSSFLVTGKEPSRFGSAHPSIVPYQVFSTQDEPLMVAVGNDQQFAGFSKALEAHWHQSEDFKTNSQRVKNRAQLLPQIAERMKTRARKEWLAVFSAAGIPAGPVNSFSDVKDSTYAQEVQLFCSFSDSHHPTVKNPIGFSRTPIDEYRSPPAYSKEVDLANWL